MRSGQYHDFLNSDFIYSFRGRLSKTSPQYELQTGSLCITQYVLQNTFPLCKRQALLDLCNCLSGIQSFRTRPATVQDGVASVQAHAVVESFLSLGGAFVT